MITTTTISRTVRIAFPEDVDFLSSEGHFSITDEAASEGARGSLAK
jgi:hypothetical protein